MKLASLVVLLVPLLLPATIFAGVDRDVVAEGRWEGAVLSVPGRVEASVIVALDSIDEHWVGEIAIPTLGLEHYPLENVKVDGRKVSFIFKNQDGVRSFRGEISEDGRVMSGDYRRDGQQMRFELDRKADSGQAGAALPEAGELQDLGVSGAELRSRFNEDREAVRVMAILSPTCSQCVMNASIMQRALLNKLDSEDLRVYVLWLPVLDGDDREDALRASASFRDPRVTQYWGASASLARQFAPVLGIEDESAWDVALLFPRGAGWGDDLPMPTDWMIARGEVDLLKQDGFDGEELARRTDVLLDAR